MKTKIVMMIILCAIFLSCKDSDKNYYTIKGKFTTDTKGFVVLMKMTDSGTQVLDTIHYSSKGKFSKKEALKDDAILVLQGPEDYILFYPQNKETIEITGKVSDLAQSYTIKGSPESIKLKELNAQQVFTRQKQKAMSDMLNQASGEERDSLVVKFTKINEELRKQQKQFVLDYINKNIGSLTTIVALYRQMGGSSLVDFTTDLDIYKKVLSGLKAQHPNSEATKSLQEFISHVESLQTHTPKDNNPKTNSQHQ